MIILYIYFVYIGISLQELQLPTVTGASRPTTGAGLGSGVLSRRTFLIVFSFTACWYLTSSRNAVASQRLVQQYEELHNNEDENSNHGHTPFGMMIALTALQLLVGFIICMILLSSISFINRASLKESPKDINERMFNIPSRGAWVKSRKGLAAVGLLHFLGCLCTNMGFAFGSASVVQVIKLLEPIETLLLTAIFNIVVLGTWHGVTCIKTISVIIIVLGTSLLLMQKSIEQNVNYESVSFALCSGIFMASRNVTKKILNQGINAQDNDKEKDWIEAAMSGMSNFCTITALAAIPATLFLVLVEILSSTGSKGTITLWMLETSGRAGKEAIFFHGLYNIASISVLSLISAQSHSLLNVGKRIFNVITAAIIFHEPIGPNGCFGLCIAACGGILYSCGPDFVRRYNRSMDSAGRNFKIFFVILILLLVINAWTQSNGVKNYIPKVLDYEPVSSPKL